MPEPADAAGLVVRTLAAEGLLLAALPLNLALTTAALLRGLVVRPARERAAEPRTVLVSGGKMTKALQLCRSFHRAGHRVVLVESRRYRLTGHRFSRAVDRFHTVPRPQDDGYAEALVRIVRQERVDVYVPVCSPVASHHDAVAKQALTAYCEVLHVGPEALDRLDDKHHFATTAAALGLLVPDSHRITDYQQVLDFDFTGRPRPYVLKSIAYDPVRRLDLTRLPRPTARETEAFVRSLPISQERPWVLQEFVEGREYCTHATVRDGRVQVHLCCESSPSQVNYAMVDRPDIEEWVLTFVGALGLTGQVSFDFIDAGADGVHAIECNPRTHSAITMLYDHPGVARAYLEDDAPLVTPTATSRPTYWLYHELWRALRRPSTAAERGRVVLRGKDAIFDWDDPLPFLMVHHVQVPLLLLQNLLALRPWLKVDFNIGKLVEPGGD